MKLTELFGKIGNKTCPCCGGAGEHKTGFECYLCDSGGDVPRRTPDDEKCDGSYQDGGPSHLNDDGRAWLKGYRKGKTITRGRTMAALDSRWNPPREEGAHRDVHPQVQSIGPVYHATRAEHWPPSAKEAPHLHFGTLQAAHERIASGEHSYGATPQHEGRWRLFEAHLQGPVHPHHIYDDEAQEVPYTAGYDTSRIYPYENETEDVGSTSFLAPHHAVKRWKEIPVGDRTAAADDAGLIHRGVSVVLPEHIHAFVHDEAQPAPARAHMLLSEVRKQHPEITSEEAHGTTGGLGNFWSPSKNKAAEYGDQGGWTAYRDHEREHHCGGYDSNMGGCPTTKVVMHAGTPPEKHHWNEVFRSGEKYDPEISWRLPVRPGAPLMVHGISWKPGEDNKHYEDRAEEKTPFERYDFLRPVKKRAGANGDLPNDLRMEFTPHHTDEKWLPRPDTGERDTFHRVQAFAGDDPARVGEMSWYPKTGEVAHVWVRNDHRRRGIGSAMWNYGVQAATEQGHKLPEHSPNQSDAGSAWAQRNARVAMPSKKYPRPEGIHTEIQPMEHGSQDWHQMERKNPGWDHQVLHGYHDDEHAGSITFSTHPRNPALSVGMMDVDPDHSGKGIASAMQDDLADAHPSHFIDHGSRTRQGKDWWDSYEDPAPHRNIHNLPQEQWGKAFDVPEEKPAPKGEAWGHHIMRLSPEDHAYVTGRGMWDGHESAKRVLKTIGDSPVTWHTDVDSPEYSGHARIAAEEAADAIHPEGRHEAGQTPLMRVLLHTKNGKTVDQVSVRPHVDYSDLPSGYDNHGRDFRLSRPVKHPSLSRTASASGEYTFSHVPATEGDPHSFEAHDQAGKNVGYATAEEHPDHVFMDEVYVHPDARGKGLGRSLTQNVLDHFQGREVRLKPDAYQAEQDKEPGPDSARLRQFYHSMGFRPDPSGRMVRTASSDDDYRMEHRPPDAEGGIPLHDLTKNLPSDIYQTLHHYDPTIGDPADNSFSEARSAIYKARGNPEAKIRIYRALPAEHAHQGFRPGDWVSTSKEYARGHARHHADPKHDWPVIRTTVRAGDLHTSGDDLREYGYNGDKPKMGMISFKGGYHQEVRDAADGTIVPVKRRPKTATIADGGPVPEGIQGSDHEGHEVVMTPQDGWAHVDGSHGHEDGSDIGDHAVYTMHHTWLPEGKYWGPNSAQNDQRLFEGDHLRPEIRKDVLNRVNTYMRPRYKEWPSWTKVYFAGSQAAQWLDQNGQGNGDFDILIGIDFERFRKDNPEYDAEADDAIAKLLTDGMHKTINEDGAWFQLQDGREVGPFDRTYFVNPLAYDIRKIHPYAAYNITDDTWAVHPLQVPEDWDATHLPESYWGYAESLLNEVKAIGQLPPEERHRMAANLWEELHTHRSDAFGDKGHGLFDLSNIVEKYMDQHPDKPWAKLYQWKNESPSGPRPWVPTTARRTTLTTLFDSRTAAAGADYGGMMIAIVPPKGICKDLAVEDGEPVDAMHVTLAYMGSSSEYTKAQREGLHALVEGWARTQKPLTANVGGVGTFVNPDQHVLWAAVDIPGGGAFRESLVETLERHGYNVRNDHGWTPHLTLSYGESHFRFMPKVKPASWEVEQIHVCVGGSWEAVALG